MRKLKEILQYYYNLFFVWPRGYTELPGNLITMALNNKFDVIGHGVNCHNAQSNGLAPQMVKTFQTDQFPLEGKEVLPAYKLGKIDYKRKNTNILLEGTTDGSCYQLRVVNMYTQFLPGADFSPAAFINTLHRLGETFKGLHIGLPQIGCGIGGGDWEEVKSWIQSILVKQYNCTVTIVMYDNS